MKRHFVIIGLFLFMSWSLGACGGGGDTASSPTPTASTTATPSTSSPTDETTNDADGDSVDDAEDNCVDTANLDQTDTDADAIGDACDSDDDADGVGDDTDNCGLASNANQADTDDNGIGDTCDTVAEPAASEETDVETLPAGGTTIYWILAADGTYLGDINYNAFSADSLCNTFGTYGSKLSATSIWNEFGQYGSDFASNSPFNDFAINPPIIVENQTPILYLTTNTIKAPRMDPFILMGLLNANGCDVER